MNQQEDVNAHPEQGEVTAVVNASEQGGKHLNLVQQNKDLAEDNSNTKGTAASESSTSGGGSSTQEETPGTEEKQKLKVFQKLTDFYKSEFAVFMAWTTITSVLAGFGGALFGVYVTKYVSLNETTIPCPAPTPPPPLPPTTPATPSELPDKLQESIGALNASLNQCLHRQESDKGRIEDLSLHLSTMKSDVEKNYTILTDKVALKTFIFEAQMDELKNVFVSKEWLFLILLMGLFEIGVVGIVWIMWQKLTETLRQKIRERNHRPRETNPVSRPETNGIQGDANILGRVTHPQLSSKVCVIAFHNETINKHTTRVKELLSQNPATSNLTTVQFLVSSVNDVLQVPPCKLYMVFVDFNERNVILEDPNKGLGDMRLTTVQALDMMGADVVLTYCKDKGSKNLPPGDLYNTELTSVRQHSELRRLESEQRMLSVFDEFNKTQRDSLIQIVKQVLK